MFCTNCGKELADGITKCEFCGAIVENHNIFSSETASVKMKNAFNSTKEKGTIYARKGVQMLKEEWNSTACSEFRIVDNKKYLNIIKLSSILIILLSLLTLNIIPIILGLSMLFLILKVEKTYLSDYSTVFVLNLFVNLATVIYNTYRINLLLGLDLQFGVTKVIVLDLIKVILSVFAVVFFYNILKGKNRKTWLIFVLSLMICLSVLQVLISLLGAYSSKVTVLQIVPLILFYASLILFILSISNSSDKIYISKSEPVGKHIKSRSIGFSVVLSILTLGIYYWIVWTYAIVSDIRKLEGKRGTAVFEWFLFNIVPIYDLVWLYTRANKLSVIGANNKIKSNGSGGLYIFMNIIGLGIVNMALIQSTLNDLAGVMDNDFIYGTIIQQGDMSVVQKVEADTNYMEKLKELNELRVAGVISEEEFTEKKAQFLAKL